MGKQNSGINGPFTGKVGTAVGVVLNGTAVVRSRPVKRTKPFSRAELAQQARFRLMSAFLSNSMTLLNITFKNIAIRMTGFNKAYSYNVKNAITGQFPNLTIDYSMVLMSRGDLPGTESVRFISPESGLLEFNWADNSGKGLARETDKVFIAIHSEKNMNWIHKINVANRNAGAVKLNIPQFKGERVHGYLGFISEDEKEVSDSRYLGALDLAN